MTPTLLFGGSHLAESRLLYVDEQQGSPGSARGVSLKPAVGSRCPTLPRPGLSRRLRSPPAVLTLTGSAGVVSVVVEMAGPTWIPSQRDGSLICRKASSRSKPARSSWRSLV